MVVEVAKWSVSLPLALVTRDRTLLSLVLREIVKFISQVFIRTTLLPDVKHFVYMEELVMLKLERNLQEKLNSKFTLKSTLK